MSCVNHLCYAVCLTISGLKRDKKKADKKENLKEVAQICNCMGELLAKYGENYKSQESRVFPPENNVVVQKPLRVNVDKTTELFLRCFVIL